MAPVASSQQKGGLASDIPVAGVRAGQSSDAGLPTTPVWMFFAGTLTACLPLALLLKPTLLVGGDYSFIQWMVGYVGEYLRQNLCYPNTLNTGGFVGLMELPFYGFGFFPIVGSIAAFTGSALALRITLASLFIWQFWTVNKTSLTLTRQRLVSFAVAAMVSWNIYPLTNLYNRGAVAEVVASVFLTCSFCFMLKLIVLPKQQHSLALKLASGLSFTAAAATHAVTFKFGTLFMLAFLLPFLPLLDWRHLIRWALPNALLAALVLAPWLYLVITTLGLDPSSAGTLTIHTNDLDSIWTRLSPLPFDSLTLKEGLHATTPFLDTQLSVPLLLLCATMLLSCSSNIVERIRSNKLLAVGCIASASLFLFTLAISVVPNLLSGSFARTFDHLQFGYRAITYINLSLLGLAATAGGLFAAKQSSAAQSYGRTCIILALLALAFCAMCVKLNRGAAVANDHTTEEATLFGRREALINYDPRITPYDDYVRTASFSKANLTDKISATRTIKFLVGTGKTFGRTAPVSLDLNQNTLVITDVVPFPWNHLLLDRKKVPPKSIGITTLKGGIRVLCLPVESGSHCLEYTFESDRTWAILNGLSRVVFVVWLIATAATAITMALRTRQMRTGSNHLAVAARD